MNWPIGWTDLQINGTYETEYWKTASTTDIQGNHLREMWFNREAGAPPQGPQPHEQRAGECGCALHPVPPCGTQENQGCELPDLPNGVQTEASATRKALWHSRVQQDSRPTISRVEVGVKHRVDRLRCLGNGQVPAVAALAWRVLTQ